MKNNILLATLRGETTTRPPVWFMRQAGRVLPSYLALKEQYTFWQMMKDPKLAAQVTLLPIHDLGVDAAILFSDILVIPYAMGMGLEFTDGGPVFETPLKDVSNPVQMLKPQPEKLQYIYNAIDEIVRTRPEGTPLIGFCGGPLTVLSYMIQGLGSRSEFPEAVKFIFSDKATTAKLVDAITELSIEYALNQVKHGVDAFQLFETHAGLIPWDVYHDLFIPSVRKIAAAVRQTGTPFIYFPKGAGMGLQHITEAEGDFIGVDWQTSIHDARRVLPANVGIQGNLDPRLLYAPQDVIATELEKYIAFGQQNNKWIFNLGHGLMPGIPVENVKFVIDWIKAAEWRV